MKGKSPPSSSSPPPPFMPSSSRPQFWIYDVFLSFRGEDTRRAFTDHLYAALDRAGVRTFRDAEGLRRGGNIAQELVGTIQGCKIALIVFSENYADSKWCLDELVQIMECRRTRNQQVFPIFYHVDPSDVRNQTGWFGAAFERHEAEISSADDHRESAGILRLWSALKVGVISYWSKLLDKRHQGTESMFSEKQKELADKIARRRAALREAANLAGFNIGNRHEAEFIDSIVDEICRQLTTTYLNLAVHPVGIDDRVEDITKCLQVGSDDVRIVGIWGMGGIGKTTVAKAIYNKFYHDFESKSFLGNVRETAKTSQGKITLQERLLSDILKPLKIEVGHADRGIVVIKERLGSQKVLVIVDDVDDVDQLNALAISQDSFGAGSRIVITTRDRHLLDQLNVESVHIVQEMNENEGLELFSWHAFQNPSPGEDYIELSRRLVAYCGGLPLALEVLGSFLCKRSTGEWKSTLKKLEKIPHDKIQSKLRISFDTLDESQRNIFLHICCFFIGMDKEFVKLILKGCGFHPEREISVLAQRCLVTVNEKNKLKMHDLLRDMGREVVREESPNRPERRSRLWQQDDVIDVLTDETGTEETEGLALSLQGFDDKSFSAEAFRNMKRLKLLQLNYVQLTGDCNMLPKKLRWLSLRGFSPQIIQNEFLNEKNVVSIDLRYSNLVRVWEDSTRVGKLEILNLSHSHYLTQLPDFSWLWRLKFLILKDCVSLSKIDKSIRDLHQLRLLNLKGCIMLEDLPKEFYQLSLVRILILSGCLRFKNLGKGIRGMFSLETLVISGTAIREVPSSVDCLPELDCSSRQGLSRLERSFEDERSLERPLEDERSASSSLDQDTQEDLIEVLRERVEGR